MEARREHRPLQDAVPAHRGPSGRQLLALPHERSLRGERPPTASPATSRTTTAPPIRTTPRPASRGRVRTATPPRPGSPRASIDHSKTRFPLTGAHQGVNCARCHTNGQYAGTPTDCVSCHRSNYNGATNPNHQAGGFSTTCQSCHTTNAWKPASFDHNTTRFALTGAHRNTDCARCHTNGRYAGTPTTCVSCHQSKYDSASPNHRASGFPTSCQDCHSTSTWSGATFDHDGRYFPIYSGNHRSVWGSSCATCHTNPSNYAVFACINCHEHSKSSTDNDHKNVRGYSYDSASCYRCHPRGRE
jgi:hypothetical protein